jgi:CHASE3 domain sensor protein
MKQLAAAVDEKLSELATSIQLHDQGEPRGWRDLLLSDIGKEKMERVRTLTEQLLAEEGMQVEKGRKGVYQTLMLNRIGTTAMAAVSLLALFHVPAPDGDARAPHRRGGAAHRERARPARGRGRGAHAAS